MTDPEAPHGRKKDGTPKKPNAFSKGGANYRPPINHGSKGEGWGGEAKPNRVIPTVTPEQGGEALRAYKALSPEQQAHIAELRALRQIEREERLALVEDKMFFHAMGNEANSLPASIAYANRVGGMPGQSVKLEADSNVNLKLDPSSLSEEQLAAIASIKVRPG